MEGLNLRKLIDTQQFEGKNIPEEHLDKVAAMEFRRLFGIGGKGCIPEVFVGLYKKPRYFSKEELAEVLLGSKLADTMEAAMTSVDHMAKYSHIPDYVLTKIETYKSPDRYVWQYHSEDPYPFWY